MARNASWQCVPFLWHAAWRERGVKTCLRPLCALCTHFYAHFTQCANKMTAIDTQWNDLFTHTSRYLCAPRRIAPTTSRMREFVATFFGTQSRFAALSIGFTHISTNCGWFNTLNTRDSVVAEQRTCRTCLYLVATGLLHLGEEEKMQHEQITKVLRQKKRQLHLEERKQGQCGLGDGWLEDMSSDIVISYWQNSTRKVHALTPVPSSLNGIIGPNYKFPWHALTRTAPQRWRQVCAVLTHCSRVWHEIDACQNNSGTHQFRIKLFLNFSFQNYLYDTARTPRTLHGRFTLLSEDFTQRHAQERVIARTKCVQVSM